MKPRAEKDKKYEERHREERKAKSLVWVTWIFYLCQPFDWDLNGGFGAFLRSVAVRFASSNLSGAYSLMKEEAELANLEADKAHAEEVIEQAQTAVETRDKALEERHILINAFAALVFLLDRRTFFVPQYFSVRAFLIDFLFSGVHDWYVVEL